ncbi:hypothetical protein [Mesorhizobium sp. WSM2239]|uniref:Uncharacterized protein n=2 Tax=unclassified Mesorhizobium TaxID=325217 RepID=A0AAU8DG35_9HYPH
MFFATGLACTTPVPGPGGRTPHHIGCSEARQALIAGADEYRSRLVLAIPGSSIKAVSALARS